MYWSASYSNSVIYFYFSSFTSLSYCNYSLSCLSSSNLS